MKIQIRIILLIAISACTAEKTIPASPGKTRAPLDVSYEVSKRSSRGATLRLKFTFWEQCESLTYRLRDGKASETIANPVSPLEREIFVPGNGVLEIEMNAGGRSYRSSHEILVYEPSESSDKPLPGKRRVKELK